MPDTGMALLILFGLFFGLLFVKIPVVFCIGLSSVATMAYLGVPIQMMAQNMVKGISSFVLLAVPFFVLAGEIMGCGSISNRLIVLSDALVGWLRGGLAMVNIVVSVFFGGISGSSAADTASIGSVIIPMMRKKGYDAEFSTCVTMTSSVQGILIPPSQNMIIYSLVAGGVSVVKLFMAGYLPGLALAGALMTYSYYASIKRNYPKGRAFNLGELWRAFKQSFLGLLTIFIVIFGVVCGVFTATEAAAIAVIYSFLITYFVYREITLVQTWNLLGGTLKTMSMILILIAVSNGFSWVMAYLKVPQMVASAILSVTGEKYLILLLVNILLFGVGMIMDMACSIILLTPILLPIVTSVGVDPVHFGVIMVLNLGIGLLTPPVGTTLFIGSAISGVKVGALTRAMLPFYLTMVVVLLLVTYIPEICMFIPNLL